jgi:dATP pyrophosphohydrolase
VLTEIPIRCYGVSVVVLRRTGRRYQVLLLKRSASSNGQWAQVAGKLESGETAWQAALREIKEETTLVPEALYSADLLEQFYEIGKDAIWVAPVFVAFVDRNAEVTLNDEHTEWKWMTPARAIATLPFQGQKDILMGVERAFVKKRPPELLRIATN